MCLQWSSKDYPALVCLLLEEVCISLCVRCCHLDWLPPFRINAVRYPGLPFPLPSVHLHTLPRGASDLPCGFLQRSWNKFSAESCTLRRFWGRLTIRQTPLRDDQKLRGGSIQSWSQHCRKPKQLWQKYLFQGTEQDIWGWTCYLLTLEGTRMLLLTWCCYNIVEWWEVFHTASLTTQAAEGRVGISLPPVEPWDLNWRISI